ncbi:Cation/H(+) antiporter 3 [Linum grandiflorum]
MSYIPSDITWENETLCYAFPSRISPVQIFEDKDGISVLNHILIGTLTHFNFQVLTIFLLCNVLRFFLRRLGVISFASQCLAGVILGPTFTSNFEYYKYTIFNHESQDVLNAAARMGYSLFMFTTGVKTDVGMMLRSGRKIMILGIASVLVPYIISLIYQSERLFIGPGLRERMAIIGFSALQAMTTFPVVSHLLVELKLTNSELGRLALSSSLVSGLLAACLELSSIISTEIHGLLNSCITVVWALFAAFVLRPIMLWVVKQTPPGHKFHPAFIPLILGVAFVYQIYLDAMNQSQALGPFILGLAVPAGPPLGSLLVDSIEPINNSVLFPLFVVTSAMRGDLHVIFATDIPDKAYYITSIIVSLFVKFLICLLLSLPWMPPTDSVVLALIMSSKGVYELGVYSSHRDSRAISESVFSLCLMYIILNATLIPVLVKYLYDPSKKYAGYQARNLFSLKPKTELKVLTCMHRSHHIGHMINLLDVMCPTDDNPIGVYALHLVELMGRTTPMLISHQKQKAVSDSCSIEVILAFNQFERRTFGLTTVYTFTSISQPKFMQDDICTLALDKSTSLILIPFHITWALDGSIESEDTVIRTLNSKVLEIAPCSVGIFFNRGNTKAHHDAAVAQQRSSDASNSDVSSSYSVCMIYLGGRDDHEALCIATRMCTDSSIQLTILHLIPHEHGSNRSGKRLSHESLFDDVVLKQVLKQVSDLPNVQYTDRFVQDGPHTAMLIRSLVDDHDLFVVGRRNGVEESPQTTGLGEWSEIPELGIIGDLLASKDLETKAAVLVVQQQRLFK